MPPFFEIACVITVLIAGVTGGVNYSEVYLFHHSEDEAPRKFLMLIAYVLGFPLIAVLVLCLCKWLILQVSL